MAVDFDVIVIGSGFGAIIPGAVAVNPTLSIVSMAARAVKSIA
jgi:hypothetical protein